VTTRALHVDADLTLARLLRERLAGDGVVVDHATGLAEARALLAARVYIAVVREPRLPHGDGEVLRCGVLAVDRGRREAWVGDRPLGLSALEFNLLAHLVEHPDQVRSREARLAAVWGPAGACRNGGSNVVDVTIGRVRRRLGAAPGTPVPFPAPCTPAFTIRSRVGGTRSSRVAAIAHEPAHRGRELAERDRLVDPGHRTGVGIAGDVLGGIA
jgi:DNA-binding response OmpR family regulator